jgi:hypothetical protein
LAFRSALARQPPSIGVSKALLLSSLERSLLNENALALVSLPGATVTNHHGAKGRVLAGAAGESGVPSWEEHEMFEIGARDAKGAVALHAEQLALAEFDVARGTRGVSDDRKDCDLVAPVRLLT